jgi:hypothetical protein
MRQAVTNVLVSGAVLCAAALIAVEACGQSLPTQAPRRPTDPVQRELQRRFESEAIERALAARPRRPSDHERRIMLAQIKEDFLRLQIIDDDLKEQAARADAIDLRSVVRSASDIERRAARLRDNLSLPEIAAVSDPDNADADTGLVQLRSLLSRLSKSIQAFAENPLFESAKVVDAGLSAQARRDLQQIINLSKQIRKTGERLSRAQ